MDISQYFFEKCRLNRSVAYIYLSSSSVKLTFPASNPSCDACSITGCLWLSAVSSGTITNLNTDGVRNVTQTAAVRSFHVRTKKCTPFSSALADSITVRKSYSSEKIVLRIPYCGLYCVSASFNIDEPSWFIYSPSPPVAHLYLLNWFLGKMHKR